MAGNLMKMLSVLGAIVLSLAVCTHGSTYINSSPVNCAFSVWSDWALDSTGHFELRTRHISRPARNGGQPCTGRTADYRAVGAQPPAAPEEFIGNLLAGTAPSYSLGGGRQYTLSRDIVLVLDSTVDPVIFPYYKSFISNIVGKFCGSIGNRAQDNRLGVATLGYSAVEIHSLNDEQSREIIQAKILEFPKSLYSQANLKAGSDYARPALTNDYSGTRRYNNATKEVLFVTSERAYCSDAFLRSARQLKTTANVYVIVLGSGTTQRSCLTNLASYPVDSHFLRLEGITDISEQSIVLLAQSPVNNFCLSSTPSSRNY